MSKNELYFFGYDKIHEGLRKDYHKLNKIMQIRQFTRKQRCANTILLHFNRRGPEYYRNLTEVLLFRFWNSYENKIIAISFFDLQSHFKRKNFFFDGYIYLPHNRIEPIKDSNKTADFLGLLNSKSIQNIIDHDIKIKRLPPSINQILMNSINESHEKK